MENKRFIRAVLDKNAIIQEFQCTLNSDCYDSKDVVGKNWFDIFIGPSDHEKVMNVL